MKYNLFLQCAYCQYRKDIIKEFEQGMVTLRYLVQLIAKGCENCNDRNGSELRIQIEGKSDKEDDDEYDIEGFDEQYDINHDGTRNERKKC